MRNDHPGPPGEADAHIHVLKDGDDADRFAWRARLRDNPVTLFWWRVAVGVAGGVCMVAAALTGWLPGPGGIPLFLLGLAIWASEFDWAHGVLQWFKGWFDRLGDLPPAHRRLLAVATVVAVLATWYAAAWWAGLPGWLPDALESRLRLLPGLD